MRWATGLIVKPLAVMNHLHTRIYKYRAQVEKYWSSPLRHRHLHQSFHFTLRNYTNNIIFQKIELLLLKVNTVVLWAGKLVQSDTSSTRVFIGCRSYWKSDQLLMAQADPTWYWIQPYCLQAERSGSSAGFISLSSSTVPWRPTS